MYLIQPLALCLVALPLGAAFYFLLAKKKKNPNVLFFPIPVERIKKAVGKTHLWHRIVFSMAILGLFLLAFAVARPAQRHLWTHKWSEGVDIVLALDVSESMDATDFSPNRITVAKEVIRDFIKRRKTDRIGLVIFGGEAITKVPLTRDYPFLLQQLEAVQLRELKQGTAIGMALANAVGRLQASQSKTKVVILLTDGDSNVGSINPITAATLAQEEGIKIYSIGIGKNSRVLVPIYAYDMFGKKTHLLTQVPSYLNPELLQEIARLTKGKSYMATSENSLEQILLEIDTLEKTKVKVSPRQKDEDLYFWFAALGALLMLSSTLLKEFRFWRAKAHAA